MNTEQKAKAYDEAIERAKSLLSGNQLGNAWIYKLLPELKESKDERIRKALIKSFEIHDLRALIIPGFSAKDIIAWLEKQGKQNPCETCEEPRLNCQNFPCERKKNFKPADKVEPKFHEGDWIVHHGTENVYQVVALIDNQYQLKYGDNYTVQKCDDVDRCARLWDITKDAKEGDVLVDIYENIGIYKKCDDFDWMSYCSLGYYGGFQHFNIEHENEKTHPATKEQRDTLMKAMTDAGYTFDFDKKELKKIEQKSIWSEEDKKIWEEISDMLWEGYRQSCSKLTWDNIRDWIKPKIEYFKDRTQPKQEWSEEDETRLTNIIIMLKEGASHHFIKDDITKAVDWLKSIKPQNHWKPTEEQIRALHDMNLTGNISYAGQGKVLIELYNDLLKLKA